MAFEFQFEAIGTHWKIVIAEDISTEGKTILIDAISKRIDVFDRDYSRFREDSLITEMSKASGTYTLPTDAKPLVALYRELYMITGGLFTPLVGNIISDAGYDALYTLKTKPMTPAPRWDEVMEYSYPKLKLYTPVLLDFGAAGKGYLVDIVSSILKNFGIKNFTVDAGGDIYSANDTGTALQVALEHPDDPSQAIGIASIVNSSICGSAGNRRAWGNFHHIINPQTLTSPKHLKAVWVTAESTIIADALATCLFFTNPSACKPRFTFEYLLMSADNTVEASSGFSAELFTI